VPMCNCFHARQANISKITTFSKGTPLGRLRAQASLDLGGSALGLLQSAFKLKISYAGCLGLS